MKERFSRLRQEAEHSIDTAEIDESNLSELDIKNIIHNLEVHRIELEMQNEELQRTNRELEEAKRQYSDLFEFAPVSYVALDQQYTITRANRTFLQLVGAPRKCLISAPFTDFICPDFQDAFYLALERLKKTEEKQRLDLQLTHSNNSSLWVHVEMTSRDSGQSYLLSISDVTRQKQAEQALKASEAKFRNLFNMAVDPMFIHDMQGSFLEVNASACLKLGYSHRELVAMNVSDVGERFSKDELLETFAEVKQKGVLLFEGLHKTKDGRQFPVEVHSKIIEFEGQQAILSLARDISRRKEAEQRYELLSNVTFEGIFIHKNGIAIDVNASCSRLTGYAKDELIGKNLFTLLATPQDQEKARQMMMIHEVAPYVIKVRRKDGSVFDAELEARDIEHQGEQVRIVAIRDVTERKRAEQALKESEETNQRLADATFEAIFFSEQGICTNQNSTAERMFGYTLHEAIGKPGTDWIHLNYRGLVKHKIMSGSTEPYEAVALRKDGSTFPCEIQAKTAIHGDREVRITALRDITDRKRQEEILKHRLDYEKSLAQFSTTLLQDLPDAIEQALRYILACSTTSRTYIFENFWDSADGLCMRQIHELCAGGVEPQIDNPVLQHVAYAKDGFARWERYLSQNRIIQGNIENFPATERDILAPQGIQAILIIPLWVNQAWFGFIGFDDIWRQREWDAEDVRLLRTVSQMIGAFFERKQAEARIQNALAEKEVLLKEIHHRVKNNMQTIASLLYKQQQYTDDAQVRNILDDSVQRVKSMALIHEQLYRSEESLARINLAEYIRHFANKLLKTYRPKGRAISLTTRVEQISLPVDKSIPVALILNELVINALKYAFPDQRDGEIGIECYEESREITLIIRDNGVGLPDNFDPEHTNTLGIYLVYNLATKQLGGSIKIHTSAPTEFVIRFKH